MHVHCEIVLMRGHNICFCEELMEIVRIILIGVCIMGRQNKCFCGELSEIVRLIFSTHPYGGSD